MNFSDQLGPDFLNTVKSHPMLSYIIPPKALLMFRRRNAIGSQNCRLDFAFAAKTVQNKG